MSATVPTEAQLAVRSRRAIARAKQLLQTAAAEWADVDEFLRGSLDDAAARLDDEVRDLDEAFPARRLRGGDSRRSSRRRSRSADSASVIADGDAKMALLRAALDRLTGKTP